MEEVLQDISDSYEEGYLWRIELREGGLCGFEVSDWDSLEGLGQRFGTRAFSTYHD